jgi:hypothetical protein
VLNAGCVCAFHLVTQAVMHPIHCARHGAHFANRQQANFSAPSRVSSVLHRAIVASATLALTLIED